MDTSRHTMPLLFFQLGLASGEKEIQSFVENHKPLAPNIRLAKADFWKPAQAAFLDEAIENDSDWCELVDELDCSLR
jgi:Protein of unknown function (DUF2789)